MRAKKIYLRGFDTAFNACAHSLAATSRSDLAAIPAIVWLTLNVSAITWWLDVPTTSSNSTTGLMVTFPRHDAQCKRTNAYPIRIRSKAASRSDFLNRTARPIL